MKIEVKPIWHNQESVDQIVKERVGATLAACSAYLEKIAERYGIGSLVGRELLQGAEFIKTEVKPAASALKELLRQAELKGVKSLPECWHYNQDSREDFMDVYFKQRQERIAELEKARASED